MDLSYIEDKSYRLYLLLAYTRDEMLRVRTRELASFSILPTQSSILMAINRLGDKATPTAIAQLIPRDSQTICGILNRMEKQGLLKRVKEPNNGKRTRITPTEAGQQAFQLSVKHESINRIVNSLSEEEQRQLESCLLKLYECSAKENIGLSKNRPTNLEG
jgi:DNA-binding MarR family transcriptional regulator